MEKRLAFIGLFLGFYRLSQQQCFLGSRAAFLEVKDGPPKRREDEKGYILIAPGP